MIRELDRKQSGLSWRLIVRIVIFLVFLAPIGIGIWIYRDSIRTKIVGMMTINGEEPIPVQRMEKVAFQLDIQAVGEITGLESFPVATPTTRAGGLKIAWLVPEGSFVKPGDTVIRYDSTDAQLNLERQENRLQTTEERIKITSRNQSTDEKVLAFDRTDAEKEYEYAMTVLPQDETIFSKWDIIEAKINAGFAKSRIDFLANKARVQKRIARSDQQILAIEKNRALDEVTITQQILNSLELKIQKDGLILYRRDRMREPQLGDESWSGQVLMELVDLTALQARINVLERDAADLAKDKPVVVHLDAIPEKDFHGIVSSVTTLTQPLERNSPLKYFICNVTIYDAIEDMKQKRIKPGMSLKADVIVEKYDSCYVLPLSAIVARENESIVYVKQGDQFFPRKVVLGAMTHGQATVLSGVQDGEIVAMRNPFETRKAQLPDFGKAAAGTQQGRRGGGGPPPGGMGGGGGGGRR